MLTISSGASNLAADSGDTNNLGWSFDSGSQAFDFLAVGESLTLTYTLTSADGNSGSDSHDVTITITGTNDAPAISVGAGDSASATLAETDLGLSASGTLTVVDPDTSDTVDSAVTGVVLGGTTGGLAAADVIGMLTISSGASNLAADSGDTNNLGWSFDSGSQAFDFLAVGESLTLTYTLTSADGNSGSDSHDVTITITGTNDAPAISVGAGDSASATLAETDLGLSASGTLTVVDPDTSDTVDSAVTGVVLGGTTGGLAAADVIGMLTISSGASNLAADSGDTNNLGWSFDSGSQAFDFLAVGESLTLTYTLTSADGNSGSDSHDVTITITGTN